MDYLGVQDVVGTFKRSLPKPRLDPSGGLPKCQEIVRESMDSGAGCGGKVSNGASQSLGVDTSMDGKYGFGSPGCGGEL